MSLRFRFTLLQTVVLAVLVLCAGLLLRWALGRVLAAKLDASLLAMAETERASSSDSADGQIHLHPLPGLKAELGFARLDKLVLIVDEQDAVLASTAEAQAARIEPAARFVEEARGAGVAFRTVAGRSGEGIRLVALPIRGAKQDGCVLVVGAGMGKIEELLGTFDLALTIVALLALAACLGAGYWLTRRFLAPVSRIVAKTNEITSGHISERLEDPNSRDELADLTRSVNQMLDRLERGAESQKRFTSDVAHEIRSPLSILRGQIEVCLRRPRCGREYVETLESNLDEVDRLSHLGSSLLVLTRMDHCVSLAGATPLDLADLVLQEVRRKEPAARRAGIEMRALPSPPVHLTGNATLLSRMVANLLDNAVKYSPRGSKVAVRLVREGSAALLTVEDTGRGLAPVDQERVFDRFYRGGIASSLDPAGAGLGLSICKAVAELHGGSIRLHPREGGGTVARVRLPLRETRPAEGADTRGAASAARAARLPRAV